MDEHLARVLEEFFHPNTTNDRKKYIEKDLQSFKDDEKCVDSCLKLLHGSRHDLVLMFVLHSLEECTNGKGWFRLGQKSRDKLREHLLNSVHNFCSQNATISKFVQSKLLKLIACIARLDWNGYSHLETTLAMVQKLNNTAVEISAPLLYCIIPLCIPYLWLSCPEDIILGLKTISSCAEELSTNNAKCHLLSGDQLNCERVVFCQFVAKSVHQSLIEILSVFCHRLASLKHDEKAVNLLFESLHCIGVLLESNCVVDSASLFVKIVPYLATIVVDIDNGEIASECLHCLTESIARSLCNENGEIVHEFTRNVTEFAIKLVDRIAANQCHLHSAMSTIDFLHSITVNILPRLDHETSVLLLSQFGLLTDHYVNYSRTSHQFQFYFMSHLELQSEPRQLSSIFSMVWSIWLDQLALNAENDSKNANILSWLLNMLYAASDLAKKSPSLLENFDLPQSAVICVVDQDVETEDDPDSWLRYRKIISDTVAKLVDFEGNKIFLPFQIRLKSNLAEICIISQMPDMDVNWFLASLQTDLFIISRLAHLHSIPLEFAQYLSGLILCSRSRSAWLADFYSETQRIGSGNVDCSGLISNLIEQSLSIIVQLDINEHVDEHFEPTVLVRTAGSLLFSLLTTIRPHCFVLSLSCLSSFYKMPSNSTPIAVRLLHQKHRPLYIALCGYLLFPWRQMADDEQDWTVRRRILKAFLDDTVLDRLRAVYSGRSTTSLDAQLHLLLPPLNDLLSLTSFESNQAKMSLLKVFGGHDDIPSALLQFIINISSGPQACELLDLALPHAHFLLGTLAVQLGAQYARSLVDTLIVLVRAVDSLKHVALLSLLHILRVLCEQMSKGFDLFTSDIIHLIFDEQLQKWLLDVDTKEAFFQLILSIMHCRWRHFFPSTVIHDAPFSQMEQESIYFSTRQTPTLQLLDQRSDLLCSLLRLVIFTLNEETQPNLVQQLLTSLCSLHDKFSLFTKTCFQSVLLGPLMSVLISSLLHGRFPILHEEHISTLHRLVFSSLPESKSSFERSILFDSTCTFLDPSSNIPIDVWRQLLFDSASDIAGFEDQMRTFTNRVRVIVMKRVLTDDLIAHTAAMSW